MFLPNPGILVAGALSSARTYSEFLEHITALSTAERNWTDTSAIVANAYLTTAGALGGGMVGSSWMNPVRGASGLSAICRVVQHGLPSLPVLNDQIVNGRKLLVRMSTSTAPSGFPAVDRNGFLSSAEGTTLQPRRCDEILVWIEGQPMRMQPYLGLGPEPYVW